MAAQTSARHERGAELPRDRLLAAADELFDAEGVHVIGVDRLIKQAGVARASLYSAFGSKDELVRAYLERHLKRRQAHLDHVLSQYDTANERLLAPFIDLEAAVVDCDFHGCRFISATAEARPEEASLAVTAEYRAWLRSLFSELAAEAGARDPERLGRQLAALYDGVGVAARLDQDRALAAEAARAAAETLLEAATATTGRRSSCSTSETAPAR
jgi:AcrR family transcriptional regulator